MSARIGAAVMVVLLALYLGLVVLLAVRFLTIDEPIARGLGVALIVLPLLGLWAMLAEILFGIRSQRLGRIIADETGLPGEDLPLRPSGRPVREAAEAEFPRYQAGVEADPDSWRAWFRLGLSYDAAGDRRRARQSIRRAIELFRRRPDPLPQ